MPDEREMTLPLALARDLRDQFGSEVAHARTIGGGCIHACRRVKLVNGSCYFLKFQPATAPDLLSAEAKGLGELSAHIRVPGVAGRGETPNHRWLALEWLDLLPHGPASMHALGHTLGVLHARALPVHGAEGPGFLGSTPIDNRPTASWSEFVLTRRIEPFLQSLALQGEDLPRRKITTAITEILIDHTPHPSPLHGDLWTGNTAALADGAPVVFDPSFHAGDAECDLAMLELFGGPLPGNFYEAYSETHLLAPDRELRRPVYDLIHALNHLLHFGSGYRGMVKSCLAGLGVT